MANVVWTGATDTDFNVAGNWAPSGVPSDGDTLIFNDESTKDLDTNLSGTPHNSKSYAMLVEEGFTKQIGSSGTPLTPGNGFTTVMIRGNSPGIFIKAGSTDIDRCVVDMITTKDDAFQIDGGEVVDLIVMRGKVAVAGSTTISGDVTVQGPAGSGGDTVSKLTIPASCTLSGSEWFVKGGVLQFSTSIPTLTCTGGKVYCAGSAGVSTRLEVGGTGEFWWDAGSSTIAVAHVNGGALKTRYNRVGRTLTSGFMYDDGVIDFRIGGSNMTITNSIRVFGKNMPMFPKGAAISVAV